MLIGCLLYAPGPRIEPATSGFAGWGAAEPHQSGPRAVFQVKTVWSELRREGKRSRTPFLSGPCHFSHPWSEVFRDSTGHVTKEGRLISPTQMGKKTGLCLAKKKKKPTKVSSVYIVAK